MVRVIVPLIGGASTSVRPSTGNVVDVGSSSNRFKDLYISGNIIGGSTITGTGDASADVIVKSGTLTSNITLLETIIAGTTPLAAEYLFFFKRGTNIHTQKTLIMFDGSGNAYSQEYAIMTSNGPLVDISVTVGGSGAIEVRATKTGSDVVYKFTRTILQ
mgnify:CR=1 FL=1